MYECILLLLYRIKIRNKKMTKYDLYEKKKKNKTYNKLYDCLLV